MSNKIDSTFDSSKLELNTDDEISTSQEMESLSHENFRAMYDEIMKTNDEGAEFIEVLDGIVPLTCEMCLQKYSTGDMMHNEHGIFCLHRHTQKLDIGHELPMASELTCGQQAEKSTVAVPWGNNVINRSSNETLCTSRTDMPLNYGFDIHFEGNRRGATDIYSPELDKLYVTKDVVCSINFITQSPVPAGSKIIVTAMFSQPEHIQEVISRCPDHMMQDRNKGVKFPEQFIRCESDYAVYEEDPITKIQAVIVPYEMPQRGQNYSTYIFKFMCFNSCSKLNRRPIKVIFQLEWQGLVIGERAVQVKVCATPLRDYRHEHGGGAKKKNINISNVSKILTKAFEINSCIKKEEMCDSINVVELANQVSGTWMNSLPLGPDDIAVANCASSGISSCPPASNNWCGDYGFNLQVNTPERSRKDCVYSDMWDKVYMDKDAPLSVTFRTEGSVPLNSKIRAMMVFSRPKRANDVVKRCFRHSNEDTDKGIAYPNHVIRCESSIAVYEENSITSGLSVVLPYEFSYDCQGGPTYVFKFCCYSSCAGGINRQPVKVIFTLENENQILGRRSLDVKICASPLRDYKNENRRNDPASQLNTERTTTPTPQPSKATLQLPGPTSEPPEPAPQPPELEKVTASEFFNFMDTSNFDTSNCEDDDDEEYEDTITVYDKKLYVYLLNVQKLFRCYSAKKRQNPDSESE